MQEIKKIIILGSAALKIGEAGEFDYSGSQAIKALKQEGIYSILVNPNIATIQTSDYLADKVYLLPVTSEFIEQVIEKERPDGILLSFGGQTALNCGLDLEKKGILARYGVKVLGTPVNSIEITEDRKIFTDKLAEIDVYVPKSEIAYTTDKAVAIAEKLNYPVMVRLSFTLGGLGSGVCANEEKLRALADQAFVYSPQILIEECLTGWKEVEYEVVRDSDDNCITVCNMENFDPLGIHTGESIVVAPSQTLSNAEYHKLREIAIRTVRHLGIIGECNIQYALDPKSEEYRVIEVNARLSRSSALASKATGYPLAFVAAKLALGYSLVDLTNAVTQSTMACFEPSLDYVVVKIPRWDLKKFPNVSPKIGTSMKSVGEVMAIGRTFQESLQKALRMLDIGAIGLVANMNTLQKTNYSEEEIKEELCFPTDERIFAIPTAIEMGMSIDQIHEYTQIDYWFLHNLKEILETKNTLQSYAGGICPSHILKRAKQAGFSDTQVAVLLNLEENIVRKMRYNYGILPYVKEIDTLGGEYPAKTNYLYLSYNATEDDVPIAQHNSILVLGSGTYRIGSSVEFDWCCVNAVKTIRDSSYKAILINYNPETVSTDYDEVDRLYFDEIRQETVMDIYEKEKVHGIILSMGGQVANNLALPLHHMGANILGTSPMQIDRAEDRHKFSSMLDELHIDQPEWSELTDLTAAKEFAHKVGYPVLVRPSYVLSGAAMGVAVDDDELERFLDKATQVSVDHPVVISNFLQKAKEIELDAVAKNGKILASAISEHIENAGIHSGDATLVFPPQHVYIETIRRIQRVAAKIAMALHITGPLNIQFLAKNNHIKVIECNLRASRSFPFVSKICKYNLIELATRAILEDEVSTPRHSFLDLPYVGVKAPFFSFPRLIGVDPISGVEMASTGEVGCLGKTFHEALLKAMYSIGFCRNIKTVLVSISSKPGRHDFLESMQKMQAMNYTIYVDEEEYTFFQDKGIDVVPISSKINKQTEDISKVLHNVNFDLVISIPSSSSQSKEQGYSLRRQAVDSGVSLLTNLQLAKHIIAALERDPRLGILAIDEYKVYK